MNQLLEFIFDEDTLKGNLRNIWNKIYDPNYVNEVIINGLLKTGSEIEDLMDYLYERTGNDNLNLEKENTFKDKKEEKKEEEEKKKEEEEEENNENINYDNYYDEEEEKEENEEEENDENKEEGKKDSKTLSHILRDKKRLMKKNIEKEKKKKELKIEPFNLSENKPRNLKLPKEINMKFKATPLPIIEYNKTSLLDIEEKRKERLDLTKQKILDKYNIIKPFEFASEKRPTNFEKIKEEVEKKFESTLQFNNKYVNKDIDYDKHNGDVKYNEAGILREEYNINRNKKNEENELKRKIMEKTDLNEYERYLSENRERDNILNIEKIQKRKMELSLTRESVFTFRKEKMIKNQIKFLEHKNEEQLFLKKRAEKKEKEREKKRELVLEIDKDFQNIYKNKIKKEKENKENYINYKNEFIKLNLITKQEEKILNERRDDLIRQIRELEKIPFKRISGFDPSETPGYGLLEEMSIIELKERLDIQKKMLEDEIKSKREENKLKLNEKTDEIIQKANFIMNHRDKMRNEREIKKQMKLDEIKNQEELKKKIHEQNCFEIKNKLENKREQLKKEDEKFMKKLHEMKLQRQFLKQGKNAIEERIYGNMEDGMEKKVNDRQNKDLIDQQKKENIKWIDLKLRYQKNLNDVNQQRNLLYTYRSNYQLSKNLHDKFINEDKKYMKEIHDNDVIGNLYRKKIFRERNKFSDQLDQRNKKDKLKGYTYSDNFDKIKIINDDDDDNDNIIMNKLETENLQDNNNNIINDLENNVEGKEDEKKETIA